MYLLNGIPAFIHGRWLIIFTHGGGMITFLHLSGVRAINKVLSEAAYKVNMGRLSMLTQTLNIPYWLLFRIIKRNVNTTYRDDECYPEAFRALTSQLHSHAYGNHNHNTSIFVGWYTTSSLVQFECYENDRLLYPVVDVDYSAKPNVFLLSENIFLKKKRKIVSVLDAITFVEHRVKSFW